MKARFDTARAALTGLAMLDDERLAAENFLSVTNCAAPAWQLQTEIFTEAQLDRREGLLSGPLFTSASHPWPAQNGVYATAVAQIRLEDFSALSGLPLGSGLLQIWAHPPLPPALEIRLVSSETMGEEVTSPPFLLNELNYDTELDDFQYPRPRWASVGCHQIVGYEGPFFSYPTYELQNFRDESAVNLQSLGMSRNAARLRGLSRLDAHCQNVFETHAFGSFERFTYSADERPPPLLCLGSGLPLWFSEYGQLQVFFTLDLLTGSIHFSADWSYMP